MVRTEIFTEKCNESDFLSVLCFLCRKLGTKKTESTESTSRIALTLGFLRAVTKISSCRVNKTSKRGFKQLGISFGSIFLLFSCESTPAF